MIERGNLALTREVIFLEMAEVARYRVASVLCLSHDQVRVGIAVNEETQRPGFKFDVDAGAVSGLTPTEVRTVMREVNRGIRLELEERLTHLADEWRP